MKKLFEKAYIGKCQIKNRTVMTAMTTGFAGNDGKPTEQLVKYYEERARGGVGLIVTEIFQVNREHGVATPNQLNILIPGNLPYFARMTARIHQYGTKMFAQIHHGGSTNVPEMNGGKLYGPSAIANASGIVPEPLTLAQIEELKTQFITSAAMCKAADFDGVELHCAHGYLLCEFLSESYNQRDDQYGGSFENRCRLPIEILQGIKAVCGPDFPVAVRISADEYDPGHPGSITLEEGVKIAKALEAAGADAIDVSCCNYFSSWTAMEPYSYPQGWRKGNAKAIKEVVKVPVIATNTIKEPEFAESLLEEGVCDFVGVGRAHIADPEFVRKAKEGRTNDIRKCIGCLYCFESLLGIGYARCTVNPRMSREAVYPEAPAETGKGEPVAVIGGGPAGMQAASVLAQRGFKVTLFEKGDELGGAMNLADKTAPYKVKITWLRDVLARECEKAGVAIKLGTEATVEAVKALDPVAVFLAGGAESVCPASVPGIGSAKVVQANDVVSGKVTPTGKVAIIGAGLTGLETAELLSHSGKVESIAIADMLPTIGSTMYPVVFLDVMMQIGAFPMQQLPGHALKAVTDAGITLTKLDDNSEVNVDADYVVLAMGLKPNAEVKEAFEAAFDRVIVLGENKQAPGRIATSLSDAYIAARGFDALV